MTAQGEIYAEFIDGELKREFERRASLDSRALAVTTSSSALLTVIFALSILLTGKDTTFTSFGASGVLLSLVLFVSAAAVGLIANAAREYEVPAVETMGAMCGTHWTDSAAIARNVCATLNIATIKTLRHGNNHKAYLVGVAFVVQMIAIGVLVAALGWELRDAV